MGLVAATVTTLAAVPQVWKCWKTKSSGDLSFRMLVAQISGLSAWVAYGIIKSDPINIGSNIIGASLYVALLGFKFAMRDR